MAYTVRILVTPHKGLDTTQLTTHQTTVKDYLDGETISNIYAISTILENGFWITTIVWD